MDIWQLVIGIGSLLLLTAIINNIAENIERKQRERNIRILRYQRRIDEITDQMALFQQFDLPHTIREFLQNEVMARLEQIQQLDNKFNAAEEILDYAKQHGIENNASEEDYEPTVFDVTQLSEDEFLQKIALIRHLSQYIQTLPVLAQSNRDKPMNIQEILTDYRYQKINQYYTHKAQQHLQQENFDLARKAVESILTPISKLPVKTQVIQEIKQQAESFLNDIKNQKLQYIEKLAQEKNQQEQEQQTEPDPDVA